MKKNYLILMVFVMNINTYACYIPCDFYALQISQQTQSVVNSAYSSLDNAILNSENKYKLYKESLVKQNDLLEKITKAKKINTTQMKKVNFLLNKLILSKNVMIDIETLRAIKRLNEKIIIKAK